MSYDLKIAKAKELVDSHNAILREGIAKVDWESFLKNLQTEGGTSEESLSTFSWEDLKGFGLPLGIAKRVAPIFRDSMAEENSQTSTEGQKPSSSPGKVKNMTDRQLIESYNPLESQSAVTRRLREIADNKAFIVFNLDNTVDVDTTFKLLQEIRNDENERTSFIVNDEPRKVYRLNEKPNKLVDEDPLYPGEALRSDGTSDRINRVWPESVTLLVRQIVHLAVKDTREIRINSADDAHRILDFIESIPSESLESRIKVRYREAAIRLEELTQAQQAPSLKLSKKPISSSSASGRKNDPLKNREY